MKTKKRLLANFNILQAPPKKTGAEKEAVQLSYERTGHVSMEERI